MRNQLEKAINLCKKTGDRIIVFDNVASENPFVVMSLDEYEKVALSRSEVRGLTEEELLDKINRDIAIWKSDQNLESQESNRSEISENEPESSLSDEENAKNPKRWAIRSEVKEGAEEIIEEDRQYLEEITY